MIVMDIYQTHVTFIANQFGTYPSQHVNPNDMP